MKLFAYQIMTTLKKVVKTPLFWEIQRLNVLIAASEGIRLICQSLMIYSSCQIIYSFEYELYQTVQATEPYDLLGLFINLMILVTTIKGLYLVVKIYFNEGLVLLACKEALRLSFKILIFNISWFLINDQGQPFELEAIVTTGFWVLVVAQVTPKFKEWVCCHFIYKHAPLLNKRQYHLIYSSSASHFLDRFSTLIKMDETEELKVKFNHLSAKEVTNVETWMEEDQETIGSERYASGTYDIHLNFTYPGLWTNLDITFPVHKYALESDEDGLPTWFEWAAKFKHPKIEYDLEERPFSEVHDMAEWCHALVFDGGYAGQGMVSEEQVVTDEQNTKEIETW